MLPPTPHLFACLPPAGLAVPLHLDSTPAQGSTLLLAGAGCARQLEHTARELILKHLGIPLCLIADFASWCALGAGTRIVQGLEPKAVATIAAMRLDPRAIHRALVAVDALPPAQPQSLAHAAALHLGNPAAAPLIERAIRCEDAPLPDASGRVLRRALRRRTPFGRLEWSWLGALACRPRLGRSVEALAAEHGVGARVLRRWVKRLLGMEARVYASRPGWGWVLELALQRATTPAGPSIIR
jgi:hypothetical protein